MHKEILIDTSVLIALEKLNLLHILCKIYNVVILPEAVYREFGNINLDCVVIKKVENRLINILINDLNLGKGEAEVITLAYETNIPTLIDDLKARKIAKDLSLAVSGTIGLLIKAKDEGIIQNVLEKVLELKEKGFYISDNIIDQIKKIEKN